jgi:hypothetical protein
MTPRKINKAFALAGITMPSVRAHIERDLVAVAANLQNATAKQLAAVIAVAHTSYHAGKAACGAEVIDGDAVWIGAGVDKLKKIVVTNKVEQIRSPYTHNLYPMSGSIRDANTDKFVDRAEFESRKYCGIAADYYRQEQQSTKHMSLDYTERA